jgi:hypothetical protein
MKSSRILLAVLMIATLALAQVGDVGVGDPIQPQQPGMRKQLVNKDQAREFNESFLRVLVTGRPYDAFVLMRSAMPGAESDVEEIRMSTERMLEEVRPTYGKAIGYELVDTKSLGQSLVQYDYLFKFERNAMQCRIVYYRPSTVWVPLRLWFDDDLSQMWEDLAR